MRVLFCTTPGPGHVLPLVSTAWALRAAGHEVQFATTGSTGSVVTAGLPVADVAPGLEIGSIFYRHLPAVDRYIAAQQTDARPDHTQLIDVFAEICDAMAEGTLAEAERFRPDVVVHTLEQGTGPLVAAARGVPAVVHAFGLATPLRTVYAIAAAMHDTYERLGIATGADVTAVIDPAPPSIRIGAADEDRTGVEWWPMRFLPYCGGMQLPEWLTRVPERPRVAVTLGTTNPTFTGLTPLRSVIDAAADLDAELMLALGNADPAQLGALPPNVHACGWVPLDLLLRTSAAQIHHGGGGSLLVALATGRPQLVMPQGNDHFYNAVALQEWGAGLSRQPEEVDTSVLCTLIGDKKLSERSVTLAEEMAALPTPATIAGRLAAL